LLAGIRRGLELSGVDLSGHDFQFCFCVDNSGSMRGEKSNYARTALALLMEVLRRLEAAFLWCASARASPKRRSSSSTKK